LKSKKITIYTGWKLLIYWYLRAWISTAYVLKSSAFEKYGDDRYLALYSASSNLPRGIRSELLSENKFTSGSVDYQFGIGAVFAGLSTCFIAEKVFDHTFYGIQVGLFGGTFQR
jgi:hypothetical protein